MRIFSILKFRERRQICRDMMKAKYLRRKISGPPQTTESAHRKFSAQVVDGVERAASRAMLHAVGFKREDFKKSQIGIASTWSMVTPCNMHIDKLALEAEK